MHGNEGGEGNLLAFAWAIWAAGVVLLNLFVLTLPWVMA
jgi:hypothetical protein